MLSSLISSLRAPALLKHFPNDERYSPCRNAVYCSRQQPSASAVNGKNFAEENEKL